MIAAMAGFAALGQRQGYASEPFRMRLVGGGFEAGRWLAGVAIDLDDGWKTYWRMPGEAGIPPQFDWTKSKGVGGVEVLYPVPQRLHDLSGETVGYERRVMFPVIVTSADAVKASLHLDLFFAVCKDICIPAKAEDTLDARGAHANEADRIEEWLKRVPVAGTAVHSVTAMMDSKEAVLVTKLLRPAQDIFIESGSPAYFRKPVFSADGLEARVPVDNVKSADLKGLELKLTVVTGASGIEQAVVVE